RIANKLKRNRAHTVAKPIGCLLNLFQEAQMRCEQVQLVGFFLLGWGRFVPLVPTIDRATLVDHVKLGMTRLHVPTEGRNTVPHDASANRIGNTRDRRTKMTSANAMIVLRDARSNF